MRQLQNVLNHRMRYTKTTKFVYIIVNNNIIQTKNKIIFFYKKTILRRFRH